MASPSGPSRPTNHPSAPTAATAGRAPVDGAAPSGAPQAWTVRSLLAWIQSHLEERGIESPRLCAEILLGHVLGCERLRLYMESERVPTDAERAALRALVLRAGKHEPVQYLVGRWPFRGREFEVGPSTLIPRPATETLVEKAVTWYRESMRGEPLRMADIGTGTGVIAISVIAELHAALRLKGCAPLGGKRAAAPAADALPEIQIGSPASDGAGSPVAASAGGSSRSATGATPASLRCLATDLVPEAVALAKRNVAAHGLEASIDVRCGSLFEPFRNSRPGSFDLLCSNPPYISDSEWAKVEPNVRDYEPASALRGGADGLDLVREIVETAPHWLRSGGLLLIEIGYEQGPAALQLARDRSVWSSAEILKDFEELPRVLAAVRR